MNELKNQTIVVMGGTSGIGLAAAQQLAALGGSVVVTGRNQERAEHVRRGNPALNVEIVDASSVQALETFYRSFGSIDHLILCVSGAKGAGQFQAVDVTDLRDGFEGKFFAQFRAAQTAIPFMRKDGSLTFISASGIGCNQRSNRSDGEALSEGVASVARERHFSRSG